MKISCLNIHFQQLLATALDSTEPGPAQLKLVNCSIQWFHPCPAVKLGQISVKNASSFSSCKIWLNLHQMLKFGLIRTISTCNI